MAIFSVFLFVATYWQLGGLENSIHSFAAPLQNFCHNLLNSPSEHLAFYRAVACGTNVKDPRYQILKTVSLWHLVIVSAGHFKIIQWFLQRLLPDWRKTHMSFLFFFCLWTGAQPPVLRAFLNLSIEKSSHHWKLWFPPASALLYSSCLGLLLFPSWSGSWSFLLSWLCALLLQLLNKRSLLIQALGMAIGCFPIMIYFAPPHPMGFLFNIVFGPPLSLVLFPLCLLMLIVPTLYALSDPLLNGLLFLLNQMASAAPPNNTSAFPQTQNFVWSWGYVLGLQLLLLYRERRTHAIR